MCGVSTGVTISTSKDPEPLACSDAGNYTRLDDTAMPRLGQCVVFSLTTRRKRQLDPGRYILRLYGTCTVRSNRTHWARKGTLYNACGSI